MRAYEVRAMPREIASFLGSKAQSLGLYWLLVLCLLCSISDARAALTSGEIAALEQIYTNFPSLAVAGSQILEEYTGPVGKAWTTNFTSFCEHGEGYEFNGIYCHDGHVSGINIIVPLSITVAPNNGILQFVYGHVPAGVSTSPCVAQPEGDLYREITVQGQVKNKEEETVNQ